MISVDLRALGGKLNDHCRRALEAAAGLCLSKTHYDVELEHLLLKLSEPSDGDLALVFKRWEVNPGKVTQELMRALDRLKTGNSRAPSLSPRLPRIIRDAWVLASVQYGLPKVRSGLLLLAALFLLPSLATRDLWNPDEPRYMEVAREMVLLDDYLVPHLNGGIYSEKPPFFFWGAALLWKLGLGVNSGRVLSALFCLGTAWCVYLFTRRFLPGTPPLMASLAALSTLMLAYGLAAGVIDEGHDITELGDLTAGWRPGRQDDREITICDLTGVGVQDTAIALLAYERALERGLGLTIEA